MKKIYRRTAVKFNTLSKESKCVACGGNSTCFLLAESFIFRRAAAMCDKCYKKWLDDEVGV